MTSLAPLDLTPFFADRWWVVLVKALFAFVVLMVLTLFTIVYERKVVGLMQASDTWAEFKRMFRRVFKVPENEPSRGRGSMRI